MNGSQHVPPGWYPDPVTGSGERWWDGIAWSDEFVRPATPVAATSTAFEPYAESQTDTTGVVCMVVGALLYLARIPYSSHIWGEMDSDTVDGAYQLGTWVGTWGGFFLVSLLMVYGYRRYTTFQETGQPGSHSFKELGTPSSRLMGAGVLLSGLWYLITG